MNSGENRFCQNESVSVGCGLVVFVSQFHPGNHGNSLGHCAIAANTESVLQLLSLLVRESDTNLVWLKQGELSAVRESWKQRIFLCYLHYQYDCLQNELLNNYLNTAATNSCF